MISIPSGTTITQTTHTNKLLQPSDQCPEALEGGALNLCSAKDMCNHLGSHARATLHSPDRCGGYLDTADDIRHYLYPMCDPKKFLSSRAKTKPTTLDDIFNLPVERTISVGQQVGLALKLVKAVLQLHATPWLQPLWRLQDLAYFQTDDEGLAASLRTLHISTELVRSTPSPRRCGDTLMADIDTGDDGRQAANGALDDAQLECGVRNLTMHSLGVALLQIGQWDPLRPENIVAIRKTADLAARDSRLGPTYQRLTQKCLECDFGCGKDLAQPELQSAVYQDVVCEIEELVSLLEGRQSRKRGLEEV